MLHPKNNRIDYGNLLIPEDEYELSYAVGSTYSLDLEALMTLPVALFYSQKLDCSPTELRYDMLDAITKSSEKIAVYYQNGQLKVPQKYHHLMAYWEKGIYPITMPNHVSSFHPKVWVIRYDSKTEAPKYRVIVTSRNLTFNRDWDMAFSTDGFVSNQEQPKNKPLLDFLLYLNSQGSNFPKNFIKDLSTVKFDIPDKFQSLKFAPIGIEATESSKIYPNPITNPKQNWDELLILSPFVDNPTLKALVIRVNKSSYLLSSKEELDCIDLNLLKNFETWNFSSFIEQAEFIEQLEDGDSIPLPQNLHAKFFVATSGEASMWYIGSANCTDPAQARNVEFMIELKGKNLPGIKTKDVFKALTDPNKSDGITLFTKYDPNLRVSGEERKNIELEIRRIKYQVSCSKIIGTAIQIENATAYDLSIEIDLTGLKLQNGYEVKFKPLPESQKSTVSLKPDQKNVSNDFTGYLETSLSIFLVFEILKDDSLVSKFLLPMEIELPGSRLNKIFTSIINSREKFLKYLTFLLSEDETDIISMDDKSTKEEKKNESVTNNHFLGTPVFEKLLIAASRNPERLKSINKLIERLKSESEESKEQIISSEFESFWQIFRTYINNKS